MNSTLEERFQEVLEEELLSELKGKKWENFSDAEDKLREILHDYTSVTSPRYTIDVTEVEESHSDRGLNVKYQTQKGYFSDEYILEWLDNREKVLEEE